MIPPRRYPPPHSDHRSRFIFIFLLLVILTRAHGGHVGTKKRRSEETSKTSNQTFKNQNNRKSQQSSFSSLFHPKQFVSLGQNPHNTHDGSSHVGNSLRMKHLPSVEARLDLPQTDITALFLEQEQHKDDKESGSLDQSRQTEQSRSVLHRDIAVVFAVVSSLTMAFLAASHPPVSLVTWENNLASMTALLPWMLSSSKRLQQTYGVIMVNIIMTLQLLLSNQQLLWNHIQQQVFPVVSQMMRRIVIMELWRLVWTTAGKPILKIFQKQNPNNNSKKNHTKNNTHDDEWFHTIQYYNYVPIWMQHGITYLDDTVRRGSQKLFQKTIEKNVEHTIQVFMECIARASPMIG